MLVVFAILAQIEYIWWDVLGAVVVRGITIMVVLG